MWAPHYPTKKVGSAARANTIDAATGPPSGSRPRPVLGALNAVVPVEAETFDNGEIAQPWAHVRPAQPEAASALARTARRVLLSRCPDARRFGVCRGRLQVADLRPDGVGHVERGPGERLLDTFGSGDAADGHVDTRIAQ